MPEKNPLINCHIPLLNCPALACEQKTRIRLYLQSLQTPPQLRLKFVLPNITDHFTLHVHKDEHRNFTLFGIRKCVFQTMLVSSQCKIICEIDSDAVDRQKLGFLNFLKGTEVKVLI